MPFGSKLEKGCGLSYFVEPVLWKATELCFYKALVDFQCLSNEYVEFLFENLLNDFIRTIKGVLS